MRTDLPLDPSAARCFPSRPDRAANSCARNLSTLPAHGAITADFSLSPGYCAVLCSHYVNVQTLRKASAEPAAKPAAKPAVRGIA